MANPAPLDPEVEYWWSLPGAPTRRPPPSGRALLATFDLWKSKGHFVKKRDHAWWPEWLKGVDRARAWKASGRAMTVPTRWPDFVHEYLPNHITPSVWIDSIAPTGNRLRTGIRCWAPAGTGVLSAYCYGWVPSETEWLRGLGAAADLIRNPLWLIWAYDLDIDNLPFAMDGRDLKTKLKAREAVQKKPLDVGTQYLRDAISQAAWEPEILLSACRRRSDGVGGSGKWGVSQHMGVWDVDENRRTA